MSVFTKRLMKNGMQCSVRQMSMLKILQTKKKFSGVLKEVASKIEIPKDFNKLYVVIGSTENCFSINYANYFSRLRKPLNEYYSFNFYCNFIKDNNSRRKRTPLFTVKTRYAINEFSVNITIQRQVNETWEPKNYLTVFIQGDARHLVTDIQVRLITHDKKKKMRSYNLNTPHILDWSYQFYTGKKLLILKTDHLPAKKVQVQVDHLRASTIYYHKMP